MTCARVRGQPPAAGTAAAHEGPGDALCQTPVPARRSQDSACIPIDDGVCQVPEGIRGGVRTSLRSGSMQGVSLWWRAWMGAVVTSSHGPCQSPWMWAVVSTPWSTPEGSRHLRWFMSDQGAQFTSPAFTRRLEGAGIQLSMDGRGRALDNVLGERRWRTVKDEEG